MKILILGKTGQLGRALYDQLHTSHDVTVADRYELDIRDDNLVNKFRSFNCNCINVQNGHSFNQIISAFKKKLKKGKPTVVVLNTIKGKGIKEFENDPVWHARKLQGKEIFIGKKRLGIK